MVFLLENAVPVLAHWIKSLGDNGLGDLFHGSFVADTELLAVGHFRVGISAWSGAGTGRVAGGPEAQHTIPVARLFTGGEKEPHIRIKNPQGEDKLAQVFFRDHNQRLEGPGSWTQAWKGNGKGGAPEIFAQPGQMQADG